MRLFSRKCIIQGDKATHLPNCSHFDMDMDELASRVAAKIMTGMRREIAKAKKPRATKELQRPR